MNFFNSNHGFLYFLFIGLFGILGVCVVFAFNIFIIYVIARLIFKFILRFLSEIRSKKLRNFTGKESSEK